MKTICACTECGVAGGFHRIDCRLNVELLDLVSTLDRPKRKRFIQNPGIEAIIDLIDERAHAAATIDDSPARAAHYVQTLLEVRRALRALQS